MKKRRSLREKLAELMRDAVDGAVERPRLVEPRHRISGPRLLPANWAEIEGQHKVGPACRGCAGHGGCEVCHRNDLPPAA